MSAASTCVYTRVWLMGQELQWAGWAWVCVCVWVYVWHTRLALRDGGSGAPHFLQGVPCLPAGVCSRQTVGCLCTPPRKLLPTLTQTHRQTRNTPPHPAELRDGCGCCGGWWFGGVGTPCSSRTPLMHNSCVSIQVAILIFHEAFKKNRISQYSAFFTRQGIT